ncbi:HEPN/Toprim-associated domain-containing protein [Aliarcobacter lanthieri]|uniref:HEPN/Toprim-associated domain-containing protein n=1 Tax=Aliarcobacter lanthieri TaxID=1355374 RepID=UPI000478B296|nr:HEPN/Toprim-associated domain-containing protein [Aliarcobacter lanthieri]QKF58415.1 hypothetical protein ALANTH_0283 [Aliarcobacter lanthieri]
MGTEISLNIGELSVSWSKNSMGIDHGVIFQEENRIPVKSDYINYDYDKEQNQNLTSIEMAFSIELKTIVPRLELLGFTLKSIKKEYNDLVKNWKEEYQFLEEEGRKLNVMSFDEFCLFIKKYPIKNLDNTYTSYDYNDIKKIRKRFEYIPTIKCLPYEDFIEKDAYSELNYFEGLISFLHPYSLLRILAECSSNLSEKVIWQYGPLVEAGWAKEEDFKANVKREHRFLIATEGSSDVHILKHAFSILKPEIEDFFYFIDVTERHPFSGTGSLVKFAEGLIKIDTLNNILFVFDNDAEGIEAFNKVNSLNIPSNMQVIVLPDLEEFNNFQTQGPEGLFSANINGRAAAIECYLDLNVKNYPSPKIIWTNYKEKIKTYHGVLEYKESYQKEFFKQTRKTILNGSYSVDKLQSVINCIIKNCVSIAERK